MRILIRREVAGIVDGVGLSRFLRGVQYAVSQSLGGFLIANGAATEILESADPPDDEISGSHLLGVGIEIRTKRI